MALQQAAKILREGGKHAFHIFAPANGLCKIALDDIKRRFKTRRNGRAQFAHEAIKAAKQLFAKTRGNGCARTHP